MAAFVLGIIAAELIRHACARDPQPGRRPLHWRQGAVLLEMLFLAGVCFIPQSYNLLANSLTSLACGMQVESFRKIRGNSIATTMCIGNLRSGTELLCSYFSLRDRDLLRRAMLYYSIILCFVAGAVVGNYCVKLLGEKALLGCSALLLLAFLIMFTDEKGETDVS